MLALASGPDMVRHAPHTSEEIDKGWSLFPNGTR
jgi:hypothetical protein